MKESVCKEKGICCVSGPQTRSQAAHIENNPLGLVCVCVFWHLWQSYKTKQGNCCSATNTNMLSSNRVGAFDKRRIGDILSIQLHKEKSLWHIFLSLKWISRMLTRRIHPSRQWFWSVWPFANVSLILRSSVSVTGLRMSQALPCIHLCPGTCQTGELICWKWSNLNRRISDGYADLRDSRPGLSPDDHCDTLTQSQQNLILTTHTSLSGHGWISNETLFVRVNNLIIEQPYSLSFPFTVSVEHTVNGQQGS